MTDEEQNLPAVPEVDEIARRLRPRLAELLHRERIPPAEVEGLMADAVREVRLRMPERWDLDKRLLAVVARLCRARNEEVRRQALETLDRARAEAGEDDA